MSAVPCTRRKGGSPAWTCRIGDASRRSARAASSSSVRPKQALERRAEAAAALRVRLEVHGGEERHDGGERAGRPSGAPPPRRRVPAGRLPHQRDPLRVDPEPSRVRLTQRSAASTSSTGAG